MIFCGFEAFPTAAGLKISGVTGSEGTTSTINVASISGDRPDHVHFTAIQYCMLSPLSKLSHDEPCQTIKVGNHHVSEIQTRAVTFNADIDNLFVHNFWNSTENCAVPKSGRPILYRIVPFQHKLFGPGWIHLHGKKPRSRIR